MAAAELRTQAALAERIADREGLEAVPRDMVSRVFRQRPVDPRSLERVANALEVPAHTLYLTSGEQQPPAPVPVGPPPDAAPRRSWAWAIVAAVLAAAGLGVWLGMLPGVQAPAEATAGAEPDARALPDVGGAPLSLAVLPVEGDTTGRLTAALRWALDPEFRLTTAVSTMMSAQASPAAAAERLQVDLVVSGALERHGRQVAVRVSLYRRGESDLVWADTFLHTALPEALERAAADAAQALSVATGGTGEAHYRPPPRALADYLAGRAHLDRSRTELNVKRALTRFASALRRSPEYPAARAGLCEALVQQGILTRESRFFDEAEAQCYRALQIDPGRVETLTAWGHVLRKTGRADEAAEAFEEALARRPRHTGALLGLSEVALNRYRASRDATDAQAAVAHAEQAVASDPEFWKTHYGLGRIRYFTGDVNGAVAAVQAARRLDPNEHVLSNLGTFQFCQGDHEVALASYLAVKAQAKDFYVGDVHLGVVHYFLGHYEEAASLFERAIRTAQEDGQPEDHRVWANLADAHRHAGESEAAREAYERATALAERDLATADNPYNSRAYLAYYYTALLTLGAAAGADAAPALDAQIETALESASDAAALTRLAEALVLRGRIDRARALEARINAQCRGYSATPDLAVLRPQPGDS